MIVLIEDTRLARLTFSSPVLTVAALDELARMLDALARDSPGKPVVLASANPTIFLAGAHLGQIAELDETSCIGYAKRGRDVIHRLRGHPAPTVAAVDGSCSGGGFDLVLGCDLIAAGPSASFSHPGVRRGLVTGWGGTVEIPLAVGRAAATHAMLEGHALDVGELAARGVVVRTDGRVAAAAEKMATALAALHHGRIQAWRGLRSTRRHDHCGIFASPAIIDRAIPPD